MKPILFSTEMVRAILDGRKSQTRRIIKTDISNQFDIDADGAAFAYIDQATGDSYKPEDICPYKVGMTLWVRETWFRNYPHEYGRYWYRADGEEIDMPTIYGGTVVYGKAEGLKWRPSIHMPKEAARIFLKVTGVRVERLQDISWQDALSEGVWYSSQEFREKMLIWRDSAHVLRQLRVEYFAKLWDKLNKKRGYGWDANPWVWVIEFERVDKP